MSRIGIIVKPYLLYIPLISFVVCHKQSTISDFITKKTVSYYSLIYLLYYFGKCKQW